MLFLKNILNMPEGKGLRLVNRLSGQEVQKTAASLMSQRRGLRNPQNQNKSKNENMYKTKKCVQKQKKLSKI